MAATKTKTDTEVDFEALALANEKKALAAEERAQKMEDALAAMLPDLHWARVNNRHMFPNTAKRFDMHYQQCRDLIGQRGQEIDKTIRG